MRPKRIFRRTGERATSVLYRMANVSRARRAARVSASRKAAARKGIRRGRGVAWFARLRPGWGRVWLFAIEWFGCTIAGLAVAFASFGWTFPATWRWRPEWFRLALASSASFSAAVALVAIWSVCRQRLAVVWQGAPALVAVLLAMSFSWLAQRSAFPAAYHEVVAQWSSRAESERERLAHQVYAAYRRADPDELSTILRRAEPFLPAIEDAALRFGVSAEILVGIAATESSFLPRQSRDGGRGLFQITVAPEAARRVVEAIAGARPLDVDNPRHNTLLAAATFRHYWEQQRGDLFLALLAYNIGPHNGGLKEIMGRYGAKDFLTIQPYLQTLPADYPIRVLTHALAYRIWRTHGALLPYQRAHNAKTIQQLGIPGLDY